MFLIVEFVESTILLIYFPCRRTSFYNSNDGGDSVPCLPANLFKQTRVQYFGKRIFLHVVLVDLLTIQQMAFAQNTFLPMKY